MKFSDSVELLKGVLLLLLAAGLLAVSVWFFFRTGTLLSDSDYLAGIIHIFVGFATIRAGVELARLAVVAHFRSS